MKMNVWLDPALLLEIFQNREVYSSSNNEEFLLLLKQHNIKGHITSIGWRRIRRILEVQSDSASVSLTKVKKLLTVCEIESHVYESARSLPIIDFESALEVACAEELELGAIITHDHQKFSGSSLCILSVEDLLKRLALESRYLRKIESNSMPISIVFCNTQQLSLLHPSEVIKALTSYKVRNSIQTVIKIFDVLRKDSLNGMTQSDLALRSGYKLGTIRSVTWDFENFHMASCNHGFIQPNKYFLNLESSQVAEYIAEVLKNHEITQSIYLDLPLGGVTTRENIKQLILRTSFKEIQISGKSANDYVCRMLSWLCFAGLLEQRSGFIARPIGEGKQKGLLHEEPIADQLSLQLV